MGRPTTKNMDEKRATLLLDEQDLHFLDNPGNIAPVPHCKSGYYRFWLKNEKNYIHRVIMKAKPREYVDHINGNPADNRRQNLRIVTNMQNCWNTTSHEDSIFSRYKGVSYWRFKHFKRKKPWICQIKAGSKRLKKYFATELEAAKQYNIWALELHGEYANLNQIDED